MQKIKVLIIDDSQLIRDILTSILSSDIRLEVVGCAVDPYEARQKIKELNPDVLTLDVEMPKMNGIAFLKNLMRLRPMPVVMISTLTSEGSQITMQALEMGAIDFVEKPADLSKVMEQYRSTIIEKVIVAAAVPKTKLISYQNKLKNESDGTSASATSAPTVVKATTTAKPTNKIIAIGGSTGGLEALRNLLEQVKFRGDECIVVCLHLPGSFTHSYANRLNGILPINVKEAESGERIMPGNIYIAPGGRHLEIKRRAIGYQCVIHDQPPVSMHRPSVDVLFDSVANQAKGSATGIILTGMGKDGAQGLLNMYNSGAITYAQDEASSVVWGMPGASVEFGAVEKQNIQDLKQLAASLELFAASRV